MQLLGACVQARIRRLLQGVGVRGAGTRRACRATELAAATPLTLTLHRPPTQVPWCYVGRACVEGTSSADRWARTDNGSFGMAYEDCVWRSPLDVAAAASSARAPARTRTRRLAERQPASRQLSPRLPRHKQLAALLASSPELERYVVLMSAASHTFLHVEPPPHSEALMLTAKSDALSVRAIFSSFEHTRLLLSLATNSLLKVDEASGAVATGWRQSSEQMKLLRMPRRTARWAVERVG
jgi:hypothetical protein